MVIVVAKHFLPKGYSGLTIFPFILVSDPSDVANQVLINHEKIHIRQQLELLVLPFFIWYGVEYAFRRINYRDHSKAYRSIGFEREAYANEMDQGYLSTRRLFQFLRYIR